MGLKAQHFVVLFICRNAIFINILYLKASKPLFLLSSSLLYFFALYLQS